MRTVFPDWKARGLTALLHEHQGGFAFNKEAILGLARKAEQEGVRIFSGVAVTGFTRRNGSVGAVQTNQGSVGVDSVGLL